MGTLDVAGSVGAVSIKARKDLGGWFRAGANVYVQGYLGKVYATEHDTDNEGVDFGIFAGGFGSIRCGEHRPKEEELPFREGDFCMNSSELGLKRSVGRHVRRHGRSLRCHLQAANAAIRGSR